MHDLDIVDGLMYASYWNDGLVILDIGNGKWGGRPDKPVLVSQFKYDLDSLYKEVEDVSRPGFTRGTHTAWRQRGGKYVFIADEVYRNGNVAGAKDASAEPDVRHAAGRGRERHRASEVGGVVHAREGGVHNVWQVADTLYLGAYDAGFHVFDISGELRGDLRAQHREIASLNTADMGGIVPNAAFDWGVVVNPKDGLAYVNDFNNGLWVVRVDPKADRRPAHAVSALHRIGALAGLVATLTAAAPPDKNYYVFVASEGNDRIALVRFGPEGARVERERKIGTNPTELAGPHGLYVSPDGKWYYVTTAHGTPNGALWKFSTETDEQAGRVELGRFPATVQISPDGHYAWVVNFNLYGDMVPSSVSVVWTDQMQEVHRIPTCVMPHGSRLSPDGTRQYSACMMNDELVEIDAARMAVARTFLLKKGLEHGMTTPAIGDRLRRRPRHDGAQTGRRGVLAHLGAAVHGRPDRLGGVQQIERAGGD